MPPTYTLGPLGLTKPDPNDVIDVFPINSNMDSIDNYFLAGNGTIPIAGPKPSGANATLYNNGATYFKLNSTDIANDPGWIVEFGATQAIVVTFKPASDRAVQFWYRGTGLYHAGYYRYMSNTTTFPWVKFIGLDFAEFTTAASFTVTPASTWMKIGASTQGASAGGDMVASGGGIQLRFGGIYRCEGGLQWAGGGGPTTNIRLIGIDVDGAGPGVFNTNSSSASGTEAISQNMSITRKFNPNDVIYLWAQTNNVGGLAVSNRRLTAQRLGDSLT